MATGFRSMPVLPSGDVGGAAEFWCDRLGFHLVNTFEHEGRVAFAIVGLGTITVALQYMEDFAPGDGWSAYLYVDDAAALARDISDRGVTLEHDPAETFYGMLEFDLRTPDGHGIAFGQDLGPGDREPGL